MVKDSITTQDAADLLNEIAVNDPRACRSMFLTAWACNRTLASNPRFIPSMANGRPALGAMALLNSLFGFDEDGGAIRAAIEGKAISFSTAGEVNPDAYARKREALRMVSYDGPPYTLDERRVVKYLSELAPDLGSGADPIGFLIASHAALRGRADEFCPGRSPTSLNNKLTGSSL